MADFMNGIKPISPTFPVRPAQPAEKDHGPDDRKKKRPERNVDDSGDAERNDPDRPTIDEHV